MRRPSLLTVALLLSLALHLGGLISQGWKLPEPIGEAPRLEAMLTSPPPALLPVVAPPPRAARTRSAPPASSSGKSSAPDVSLPDAPPMAREPTAIAYESEEAEEPEWPALPEEPEILASAPAEAPVSVHEMPLAQRLPRQGRVLYSGTAGSFLTLLASGQASWEHDGERFQSRLSAGLSGPDSTLDFRSTGRLAGNQIISETSSDRRMSKQSSSLIDQAGGKVLMQRGTDHRERQITGLAVAISALPQLLVTLDETQEKAAFFVVGDFWVADSVLTALGREFIRLPAGQVEARHYQSRGNNGALIDVWLVPVWRNAPARLRIELGGLVLDLKATEVEIDGQILASSPESSSNE